MKDKWAYSVKETASVLGIGVSKCYELTRQKGFPVLKLGKRIVVPAEELKIWINNNVGKI